MKKLFFSIALACIGMNTKAVLFVYSSNTKASTTCSNTAPQASPQNTPPSKKLSPKKSSTTSSLGSSDCGNFKRAFCPKLRCLSTQKGRLLLCTFLWEMVRLTNIFCGKWKISAIFFVGNGIFIIFAP